MLEKKKSILNLNVQKEQFHEKVFTPFYYDAVPLNGGDFLMPEQPIGLRFPVQEPELNKKGLNNYRS